MKYIALVFVALLSLSSYAAKQNYKLDMKFNLQGQKMKTSIIVPDGEATLFTIGEGKEERFVEVIAKKQKNPKNILIEAKISKLDKRGIEKVVSTPRIIVLEGKSASIKQGPKGKRPTFKMKVKARRVKI